MVIHFQKGIIKIDIIWPGFTAVKNFISLPPVPLVNSISRPLPFPADACCVLWPRSLQGASYSSINSVTVILLNFISKKLYYCIGNLDYCWTYEFISPHPSILLPLSKLNLNNDFISCRVIHCTLVFFSVASFRICHNGSLVFIYHISHMHIFHCHIPKLLIWSFSTPAKQFHCYASHHIMCVHHLGLSSLTLSPEWGRQVSSASS